MSQGSLILKLLSNSGELLKLIECRQGHITVLQGSTYADLAPVQRALAGVPGPERLLISLGGTEASPSDFNLVGFGEAPVLDLDTLRALSPEILDALGASEFLSGQEVVFSAGMRRRLQILYAISEPGKVVILNDPFEPIEACWIESVASVLKHYVEQRRGLVVVTNINLIPQSWQESRSVAFQRVGEERQKTEGFSGAYMMEWRKTLEASGPVLEENINRFSIKPTKALLWAGLGALVVTLGFLNMRPKAESPYMQNANQSMAPKSDLEGRDVEFDHLGGEKKFEIIAKEIIGPITESGMADESENLASDYKATQWKDDFERELSALPESADTPDEYLLDPESDYNLDREVIRQRFLEALRDQEMAQN